MATAPRRVSTKSAPKPWQRAVEQILACWAAATAPGAPIPLRGTAAAVQASVTWMPASFRHGLKVLWCQTGTATQKAQRLGIATSALEEERSILAAMVCGGLRAHGIAIDRNGTTRQVAPLRALPKRHEDPAGPCPACARAQKCKNELLACSAIGAFIGGRPWAVLPRTDATTERFQELFPAEFSAAATPGFDAASGDRSMETSLG